MINQKKIIKNKDYGITLIALVVTIIVLLILAGISISMLSGENDILHNATNAKTETEIGQEKEIVALAYNSALAKKMSENGTTEVTAGDLNTELENQGASASGASPIKVTFTVSKRQYTVDNGIVTFAGVKSDDEQDDIELPTALGTKPYFPSDKFKQVEGTDLTTGLVITDKSDNEEFGNEYVWIEVPSTAVDSTATGGPDYSGVSGAIDYTNIATALRNYCTTDNDGNSLIVPGVTNDYGSSTETLDWVDEWFDSNGYTEGHGSENTSDTAGCGLTCSQYKEIYNMMLKSIYENGGFWIGRYEAGNTITRQSRDSASGIIPLSKIDLYPINYVRCNEAQQIASNVPNKGNYNSSLLFGIQWDLIIKHLSNKGVETNRLTGDSSDWGNFLNVEYDLNQSVVHGYKGIEYYDITTYENRFNWSPIEGEYTHPNYYDQGGERVYFSTGVTTRNMLKNIYDLAGNMEELTLEQSSYSSYYDFPCVQRGASMNAASSRTRRSIYNSNNIYTGFRVCIY